MQKTGQIPFRAALLGSALILLSACEGGFDFDLRGLGNGFDTSDAVRQPTANRPAPDNRGILSYPNYQVAIARRGDTIGDIATRVGLPADELASYNGIALNVALRQDEVIALPRRVAEPSTQTGAITSGPIGPDGGVDISTIAGNAIDRAGEPTGPAAATGKQAEAEPIRHHVERGETAYSISRLYNVSARSLADWNGLGSDLSVREGQLLLIPVAVPAPPAADKTSAPGEGSPTPEPPSASRALPDENLAAATPPPSPNLGSGRSGSGQGVLLMPVVGSIIRPYSKGKNDGIDIGAAAGTTVKAAADGTVAAITRDTDQVPIIVLRHADNLLTVYAGVDRLTIQKGDKVKRGESIAKVRAASPSFLHFEVRRGLDSVDPAEMLN